MSMRQQKKLPHGAVTWMLLTRPMIMNVVNGDLVSEYSAGWDAYNNGEEMDNTKSSEWLEGWINAYDNHLAHYEDIIGEDND